MKDLTALDIGTWINVVFKTGIVIQQNNIVLIVIIVFFANLKLWISTTAGVTDVATIWSWLTGHLSRKRMMMIIIG